MAEKSFGTIFGPFDRQEARKFLRLYKQAAKAGEESFPYRGGEALVALAKYMVEYLVSLGLLNQKEVDKNDR